MKRIIFTIAMTALAGSKLNANVSVQLTPSASTIQVGQTVIITASAQDSATSNTQFSYQFTVRNHNQGPWLVVQDFYYNHVMPWTPSDHEGTYDIGVTAWSEATQQSAPTYTVITVNPRVTSASPVLSNTANPLVGFYSAPPCAAPASMRVQFQGGSTPTAYTPFKACTGLSMNFYLAGMQASTTYTVQHILSSGTAGPRLTYTTGSIPSNISIPAHSILAGPTVPTSTSYPYVLHGTIASSPFATDLKGNVVWYALNPPYDSGYLTRPVSGGTFLSIADDPANSNALCGSTPRTVCGDHQYLREYDVAGNQIEQTSWSILNDDVNVIRAAQGRPPVRLIFLSHEGFRMPNGYTLVLATNEQVKQTSSGLKDMYGDTLIVLDPHFQALWAWDAFDYLDVNRATIVATCSKSVQGCPQQFFQKQPNGTPYTVAVDWTHANSAFYDARDGNIVVSLRHQSWAVKIAYGNGSGDGHIIWTLGYGGSFALPSGTPEDYWFSGEHDVEFQSNGLLTLFNNNNPSTLAMQPGGDSRGQAWQLDLTNMIATPVYNIDLGVFSSAVGSATLLSNGNYEWQAGFINFNTTQDYEFNSSGTLVFKDQVDSIVYRSFRMPDLYTP